MTVWEHELFSPPDSRLALGPTILHELSTTVKGRTKKKANKQ